MATFCQPCQLLKIFINCHLNHQRLFIVLVIVFLVFCRCTLAIYKQESKRLSAQALEALVSSSPQCVKRRSVVGNGNSLSSAQQPSLQPKALIGQLVSQASTCCGKRDSPAGHFSFTCNGSANITSEKQSDQAVAATTFQFKVNGP